MSYDSEMKELQDAATAAGLNCEIWWVMRGQDTLPKYSDVIDRYPTYFHAAIDAHFAAMVLALYRLYETRSDTYNILRFVDRTEEDGALTKADADLARAQCAAIKPVWLKVSKLRNMVYGHRASDKTVEEVFRAAGVTPLDCRDLVAKTKELLNSLNSKLRDSTHAFNLSATRDTIRMLDALKHEKAL